MIRENLISNWHAARSSRTNSTARWLPRITGTRRDLGINDDVRSDLYNTTNPVSTLPPLIRFQTTFASPQATNRRKRTTCPVSRFE